MRCANLASLAGCVLSLTLHGTDARGEVLQIKADLTSTVREFDGGTATQSDVASAAFPATSTQLPLPAIATLSGLDSAGKINAAGRAVTIFNNAQASGIRTPDDFGMDLAGFSLSSARSWIIEGAATERRTVRLSASDLAAAAGQKVRVSSTFFLSGVLVLSSIDATRDLTNATAEISFRITREASDGITELASGVAALVGGPAGGVTRVVSGAAGSSFRSVISLDGTVPQLPLLRVLVFSALLPSDRISYQYDAVADEPFDLVLEFQGRLVTIPDGVGAAVVFGLPQDGFDQVFQQVGGSTSSAGKAAQAKIASLVDTTGQDRADAESSRSDTLPSASKFPMCGAMGPVLLMAGLGAYGLSRTGHRRRRHKMR